MTVRQANGPLILDEMESRLLFSADMALLGLDGGSAPGGALVFAQKPAVVASVQVSAQQSVVQEAALRHEIVFIDSAVEGASDMASQLMAQQDNSRTLEVFILDAQSDGVRQISAILEGRKGIDAVHIISHGEDGQLSLGATNLNQQTLRSSAMAVSAWGETLTSEGDILLYGCDVAQSAVGKQFLSTLAQLTGADIEASTDLTGSALLGGNWNLEYAVGDIETALAPDQQIRASYGQVLATTYHVTTTADSGAGSLRQAILDANASAGADTISFSLAPTATAYVITLASALPDITGTVMLDGASQARSTPASTPAIVLDGQLTLGANGLSFVSGSSGSTVRGLEINGFSNGIYLNHVSNVTIQGNLIGTDDMGTTATANSNAGIVLDTATSNTIGGTAAGTGNIIAHNAGVGVLVLGTSSTGNAILGNRIFANGGPGIDLLGDGVTTNDTSDNQQNYPVLSSVRVTGSDSSASTLITGSINSLANRLLRIEFFASSSRDASGHGEGERYVGFMMVTTDSAGNADFTATVNGIVFDDWVSATATFNGNADTSEFSLAVRADSINVAPSGRDNSIGTVADASYTFVAGDFGFSDGGNAPADRLLYVLITSLPVNGTLRLDGQAIAAGGTVLKTDIDAGKLVYVAPSLGASNSSFGFRVRDDGGTTHGGVDTDPVSRIMRIAVAARPDLPMIDNPLGDTTATLIENSRYTLSANDFGLKDIGLSTGASTVVGQSQILLRRFLVPALEITNLPVSGVLTNNGIAVQAGDTILLNDINRGRLVYTPAAGASGTGFAGLAFKYSVSYGVAGQLQTVISSGRLTFDVTARVTILTGPDGALIAQNSQSRIIVPTDFVVGQTEINRNTSLNVTGTAKPALPSGTSQTQGQAGQPDDSAPAPPGAGARNITAIAAASGVTGSATAGVVTLRPLDIELDASIIRANILRFLADRLGPSSAPDTGSREATNVSANMAQGKSAVPEKLQLLAQAERHTAMAKLPVSTGTSAPAPLDVAQSAAGKIRDQAGERTLAAKATAHKVETAVAITALSTVWVVTRKAAIAASLLSTAPPWLKLDPLPVLYGEDDEDETWNETGQPGSPFETEAVEHLFTVAAP